MATIAAAWLHQDESAPHVHVLLLARDDTGDIGARALRRQLAGIKPEDLKEKRVSRAETANESSTLQDKYHAEVAKHFDMERGEKGSGKRNARADRTKAAAHNRKVAARARQRAAKVEQRAFEDARAAKAARVAAEEAQREAEAGRQRVEQEAAEVLEEARRKARAERERVAREAAEVAAERAAHDKRKADLEAAQAEAKFQKQQVKRLSDVSFEAQVRARKTAVAWFRAGMRYAIGAIADWAVKRQQQYSFRKNWPERLELILGPDLEQAELTDEPPAWKKEQADQLLAMKGGGDAPAQDKPPPPRSGPEL